MDFQVIDIGYEAPERPKILVVDDETALQAVIFDALESDYRILSAFNGREGVQKAKSFKPNIILMDVMMPDISGYEAVKMLNADPMTKNMPVIVMTAQNFDSSTIELMKREPNVVSFLPKPFRPKQLREMIKLFLEKK